MIVFAWYLNTPEFGPNRAFVHNFMSIERIGSGRSNGNFMLLTMWFGHFIRTCAQIASSSGFVFESWRPEPQSISSDHQNGCYSRTKKPRLKSVHGFDELKKAGPVWPLPSYPKTRSSLHSLAFRENEWRTSRLLFFVVLVIAILTI